MVRNIQQPQHDDEEEFSRGLMATSVLGATAEIIAGQREQILKTVISRYRSRDVTHDDLVGAVAELKALDDFVSNCESDRTRGQVATERMHNNGR